MKQKVYVQCNQFVVHYGSHFYIELIRRRVIKHRTMDWEIK